MANEYLDKAGLKRLRESLNSEIDAKIAEAQLGGGGSSNLPIVDENDNGKILQVVGGKWDVAELPVYDGAYSVTPSTDKELVLATSKKFMDADVKVEKIPYFETSNNANGKTVTIG